MEDNTALINAESNIAPLQLPEETTSLIKASHPEGVSAGVTGLRNMVIRSNPIRSLLVSYITTLHKAGKSPATIGQVVAAVK